MKLLIAFMFSLLLSGCQSTVTPDSHYSGFLGDYTGLKKTTTASGKTTLRWTAPGFSLNSYDSIVWNPLTWYPEPRPTGQISQPMLDTLLSDTNTSLRAAFGERKPLVSTPGTHSLIFRGAITGVGSQQEGLQFYEVIPVALVIAGTQMATGHRTMESQLYLEGELIDAKTGKPVMKMVRMGYGDTVRNKDTPLTAADLQPVINDMVKDTVQY